MTDFKAKMHQMHSWGAYSAPPNHLTGFGGRFTAWEGCAGEEEGKGREGEVEAREREGPKLLLNQGP